MAVVTEAAEALDDCAWFDAHPDRQFRARKGTSGNLWLIRRYRSIFLRLETLAPMPADNDGILERFRR